MLLKEGLERGSCEGLPPPSEGVFTDGEVCLHFPPATLPGLVEAAPTLPYLEAGRSGP